MKPKIVVLLVMAKDGHGQLIEQLEAPDIDFLLANDCREAREILKTQHSVQVVVTNVTLPDGDWGSVLERPRLPARSVRWRFLPIAALPVRRLGGSG